MYLYDAHAAIPNWIMLREKKKNKKKGQTIV